uniref:Uncharacterized protein n=1 Tax=Oryza nivara TaxID=4536 RepID=A0A679BCX9_ORYNI|nr:hypothetical protein [Oryza sativa f. spontanea]
MAAGGLQLDRHLPVVSMSVSLLRRRESNLRRRVSWQERRVAKSRSIYFVFHLARQFGNQTATWCGWRQRSRAIHAFCFGSSLLSALKLRSTPSCHFFYPSPPSPPHLGSSSSSSSTSSLYTTATASMYDLVHRAWAAAGHHISRRH